MSVCNKNSIASTFENLFGNSNSFFARELKLGELEGYPHESEMHPNFNYVKQEL